MTAITAAALRRWPLPAMDQQRGKDSRGTVLVVGGAREVPGAMRLAGEAALRVGAGRLQLATNRSLAGELGVAVPEALVAGLPETRAGQLARGAAAALRSRLGECDALLVGPGMADSAWVAAVIAAYAARNRGPVVVDAGALVALAAGRHPRARRAARCRVIATPHAGELARLSGRPVDDIVARPEEAARETAAALGIIVVLKGAVTYLAAPDGQVLSNRAGNHGLGTSGSGDVLAGAVAGLCARGAEPLQAAAWAVHLHARAGEVLARRMGPLGYLARELAPELPRLLATLDRRR